MTEHYTYVYRDPSRMNAKGVPEEIYVGKGKGKRAYYHLTRKDMHPLVQRLQKMKRNGIIPDIEIIPALDHEHALFMEVCLIEVFGRKDLGLGPLLNLTDGGEGCANMSPESRKIAGEKISAATKGRKQTAEHTARISETLTGKKQPQKGPAISAAMKGKPSPMRGIPRAPETVEKMRQALTGKKNPKLSAAKRGVKQPRVSLAMSKPCTLDGITIYPSRRAMIAAIGQSKTTGACSPNFRYV